jgi:MFS family permease
VSPQRVIRTYLIIAGIYTLSASLIWGVNTLFLLDAGLTIFEVFVANAFFTAGMVVFEIPTGVVADTAGRRVSFLLSLSVLILGTIGYLLLAESGAGVVAFSAVSVVLGLGFTFYSGAVEAWIVDALNATGYTGNLDQVFVRGGLVTGAAMLIGTLGGGVLGGIDLAIPFVARVVLLAAALGVAAFAMHDIGFEPRPVPARRYPAEMRRTARVGIRYGWDNRSIRLLLMISLIQMGVFTWAFYAWPPLFLELLGSDAVWVAGAVASGIALSMMIGNALVGFLTRFCGRRTTIMLWSVAVSGAAAIVVGVADSFWVAMPALLVSTATVGVMTPVKQSYLNQLIPSEERATVLSVDSMSGSVGGVVGQVGLGGIAGVASIGVGFVTGAVVSLLALVPLGALRRHSDTADLIVGTAPGPNAACAAQGIPEIAAVDTTPRRTAADV